MNGYKIAADSYRAIIDRENPAGEVLEEMNRKIKALDIMADTDRLTQYELFNSGAFNDIVKGYVLKALKENNNASCTELLQTIQSLFDEMTAEQAEQFYLNSG